MESENTFTPRKNRPLPFLNTSTRERRGRWLPGGAPSGLFPANVSWCRLAHSTPRMKSTAGTAFSRRFRAALSGQAAMYLFASCSPIPSGVEYIFPTPSLPMEFFILLLVLGLLSGGLHLCEGLPGRFSGTKSPHSGNGSLRIKGTSEFPFLPPKPPAETRKSLPPPVESPVQPIPYASCRRPGTGTRLRPSLPAQPAAGPERQARTVAPRVLFLGILHRRQAALLDRRVCAVSGNRVLRQVQH